VGNLQSLGYLQTRANMYAGAARGTFWRGVTYGLLPQVPGDGKTACLTNCGCDLVIENGDDNTLLVTWVLNPSLENCKDCQRLASEWTPLVITIPDDLVESAFKIGVDARATIEGIIKVDFSEYHLNHHKHHAH